MRNLKKVLALVVAFSMMLSVVAFADYADVAEDASYADAVELLSALDIIKGDDLGNFNPDKTITRAEFAAVVCRALGYGDVAGVNNFVDVPADHWAAGVIGYAAQLGIVNGYGDNKFGPEDNVTYDQAVKMLVVALGFENVAQRKGGYPSGYLAVASQYKITSGVKATTEAPRATVAQLVYNALSTPKMDQTSFGTYNEKWEVLDGKGGRDYATLLTDRDIYIATGVIDDSDKDADKVKITTTEASDDLEFADDKPYTLYVNGSYIKDYDKQNVTVYVEKDSRNDYQVLAVTASADGETLTIYSDDYKITEKNTDGSYKVTYYTSSDSSNTKTIKVDKDVKIEKNKKSQSDDLETFLDAQVKNDVELVFVENDGDSSYDAVVATEYKSSRVTDVNVDKDYLITKLAGRINFDFDDDSVTIVLMDDKGADLQLSDFKEDDVVAYFFDETKSDYKYIKIVKLTDSAITGTVKSTSTKNGKNYVTIDGTKYEVASSCGTLKTEDEGTFYIGMTGKIVEFEGTSSNDDYAYILEASASDKAFGDDIWSLKLLTAKNGIVTYDLTEDASKDFSEDQKTGEKDEKGNEIIKPAYMKSLNGVTTAGKYTYAKAIDAKDLGNTARLITFKTNSKGEIKSFENAEGTFAKVNGTYNANAQSVDKKSLEDDAVVYDVTATKVDNVYATDINYLVDDGDYQGYVLRNADGEYVALVVTEGAAVLSDDNGFAIVTDVDYSTVDGEDLYEVTYLQDGEEGTVTFNDNSTLVRGVSGNNSDYENLTTGDVIMFNASADGIVNNYAILGKIKNGQLAINESALKAFSEDNEFYYGYIANDEKLNGKGETIELVAGNAASTTISILEKANQYTYDNGNTRNVNIKNGDIFGTKEVDYATVDESTGKVTKASMIFIRVVNGTVVDAYTFNDRVTVLSTGKVDGINTIYIDNGTKETVKDKDGNEVKEIPTKTFSTSVEEKTEEEVITNDKIEEVELD